MSLTRQIPIFWDTPSSWSRQGWDMNLFNPEKQLDMLDREMRNMNMRSGMRDMNLRSDSQISNMKSDFDRMAANMRSDNQLANMRSDFDRMAANMQGDDRMVTYRPLSSSFSNYSSPMTSVVPSSSMMMRPMESDYNSSFQQMDREMRRMSEEMNRMFSHVQHLIPIDSKPDTWRTRENFLMENPIIHSRDGQKKFQLQFDVRQFKPEEIIVKTAGNQLSVHARHEEKDDSKSVFREYSRQYTIPKDVNPESLISKMSRDGLLAIEAPLPVEEESVKMIPIEHK